MFNEKVNCKQLIKRRQTTTLLLYIIVYNRLLLKQSFKER